MQLENIKGIRFGMFIIEKNLVLILLGTRYFRGGGEGGSQLSGARYFWDFMRSQKLLTLRSRGRYYGNFTVLETLLYS